jgi:hypothetical protein
MQVTLLKKSSLKGATEALTVVMETWIGLSNSIPKVRRFVKLSIWLDERGGWV